MTPFTENNNFDATVNEYDTNDPVRGGPGGVANNPLQSLANRARWLYNKVQAILTAIGLLGPINSPNFTEARCRDLKINAVIHHPNGAPFARRVRMGFESIVRDARLSAEVTPAWMRHTAATWLMEAGVDIWEAAGYLGMTVKTLEKCYGDYRATRQAAALHAHERR